MQTISSISFIILGRIFITDKAVWYCFVFWKQLFAVGHQDLDFLLSFYALEC